MQFWQCLGLLLFFTVGLSTGGNAQDSQSALADIYQGKVSTEDINKTTAAKLKTIVTFEKGSQKLVSALQSIARQTGLKLSYSEQVIPYRQKVIIKKAKLPAEQALWNILEGTGYRFGISASGQLVLLKMQRPSPPSQQETITGTVTDGQTGQTLPGVNILVKSTSSGTSTDAQGQYKLTVESLQDTLVFSFVGYQTQEVTINGRTEINVQMLSKAITGQEMIVTALGINREARSLGYSVSQVETEDITLNRSTNIANELQGKIAGVNISQLGTGPGGSSKIRIRGQSSFGASNSPLIVVNGVPIDNTSFGVEGEISERGSDRFSDSGDGLSSINPDNIESMTVLKSAAAAALYGSRAKDGVIIIETKNRAAGSNLQIELNSNFTTESPLDYRDYQMQYGQGENGERPTSPFPTSGVWSFGEKFEPSMTHVLFDGLEVPYEPQPDQLKEYYRNGYNFNNSVSVSSGGENGGFNLTFSNLTSESILPGSNFQRNTVGIGFIQSLLDDRLTMSGNIDYSNEDRKNPPNIAQQDYSPVVIYTLANSMPMDVLKENAFTEEGDETLWSRFTNRTNPYFALSRFENNIRDRVFGNLTLQYEFTDWFSFQGRVGQDYYQRNQEYNLPTGSQRQPPAPIGFVNGEYVEDQLTFRELNADFLININQTFGDYGIDFNIGGNQRRLKIDRNNVLGEDFFQRDLYTIGNARITDPAQEISEKQTNSLYGSAELSFKDLFYLTGTLRNDWFSTLSPENRSILYPSLTGSFIFTDVFTNLPDWMTYGQIRASYAEVGSDTDVAPYSNDLFYSINANLFRGNPLGSISGTTVPNTDLKPMRVSEWDIGLEMRLFDDITIKASYYEKKSSDQILNQQIPVSSGYTSRLVNVGESENKGVEFLLNFSPINRQSFSMNTNFNVSYNTSKVISLGESIGDNAITVGSAQFHGELRQVEGEEMNQLYGWGFLRDEQGRRVFNEATGRFIRTNEQISFGSSIPNWVGGITQNFNYKNWSASFLIDFKLGHNMISGTHINAYRHGLDKATLVGREQGYVIGDGVNPDGSENTTRSDVQAYYETIRSFRMSEQSVFNAGSWQLRKVSLGYDFTNFLPDRVGINGARIDIVANNVAVLKKWVPHIHPDQNGIISDREQGLEATGLPITRSLGFNLNINL